MAAFSLCSFGVLSKFAAKLIPTFNHNLLYHL